MVTTCYIERVEQPNNPGIESFTEQRFSKDEFQDQLFDEADASHRLPHAISVQRPNIIGHSNPIHRPVQNHIENEDDNHFAMSPRRPVQHRVEDESNDHFDTSHPRRPARKFPCPCPCSNNDIENLCPSGCRPRARYL